jgi:hypothetical protein
MSSAELVYAALDFRTEMAHQALDRPGGCVTKGANRAAFDLFAVGKRYREW